MAVTSGCRVLWLVAAVPMPIRLDTAAAAPASTPASLTLNRSERNTEPEPQLLGRAHLVEQVGRRGGVTGEPVAPQLAEGRLVGVSRRPA